MKILHKEIFLIGFDVENPKNKNDCNVYAGSKNYERHTKNPPKEQPRVVQEIGKYAMTYHQRTKFTRVISEKSKRMTVQGWNEPYMTNIDYETFVARFGAALWAK